MNWYLKVLGNYAAFRGRARRKEYWMFILFNQIILLVLGSGRDSLWDAQAWPYLTHITSFTPWRSWFQLSL